MHLYPPYPELHQAYAIVNVVESVSAADLMKALHTFIKAGQEPPVSLLTHVLTETGTFASKMDPGGLSERFVRDNVGGAVLSAVFPYLRPPQQVFLLAMALRDRAAAVIATIEQLRPGWSREQCETYPVLHRFIASSEPVAPTEDDDATHSSSIAAMLQTLFVV